MSIITQLTQQNQCLMHDRYSLISDPTVQRCVDMFILRCVHESGESQLGKKELVEYLEIRVPLLQLHQEIFQALQRDCASPSRLLHIMPPPPVVENKHGFDSYKSTINQNDFEYLLLQLVTAGVERFVEREPQITLLKKETVVMSYDWSSKPLYGQSRFATTQPTFVFVLKLDTLVDTPLYISPFMGVSENHHTVSTTVESPQKTVTQEEQLDEVKEYTLPSAKFFSEEHDL